MRRRGRAVILVDRGLSRRERRVTLAHELVHDEWGGHATLLHGRESWAVVQCREERRVDREVARRLVPADELAGFLERQVEITGQVDVGDVADEFDVPCWVARLAIGGAPIE